MYTNTINCGIITHCIYVLGFEKRAHFVQNYNFHYGSNSRACTYQHNVYMYNTNLNFQMRIYQQLMEAARDTKQSALGSSQAVL